jgi:hypothetical protein
VGGGWGFVMERMVNSMRIDELLDGKKKKIMVE